MTCLGPAWCASWAFTGGCWAVSQGGYTSGSPCPWVRQHGHCAGHHSTAWGLSPLPVCGGPSHGDLLCPWLPVNLRTCSQRSLPCARLPRSSSKNRVGARCCLRWAPSSLWAPLRTERREATHGRGLLLLVAPRPPSCRVSSCRQAFALLWEGFPSWVVPVVSCSIILSLTRRQENTCFCFCVKSHWLPVTWRPTHVCACMCMCVVCV